ncbi:MAG: hypothetical protein JXN10_08210 [Clostridia bacterium]|nr:hypothetical protein [Clostridia bacterium]MBN2883498.1 hypothetical protein [Clostridia bacterium]
MSKNNEYRYSKRLSLILAIIISMIILPSIASADAGPKPNITIKAVNMPNQMCYMDLLVEVDRQGETDPEYLTDDYNSEMVAALSQYYVDGWGAAVVNRENIIFDDIKCKVVDGESTKSFGYMPPDRFRIIVVTEDGNIKVSNVIDKKVFDSTVDFDYLSGEASERAVIPGFLMKFILTLLLTLTIEGLLFLAFKFGFAKYWGWVLGINIFTQIFLYAAIIFGTYLGGIFFAIIMYVLAEIFIFISETIAYAFILKSRPAGYRIGYSIAANTISLIAGLILFGILT